MADRRYYVKVIPIRAEDSPNVALALAQKAAGLRPTGEVLVPGVLSWPDYIERRATWDKVRQTVGLDAKFWEGKDALLFPPHWLNHSARLHLRYRSKTGRQAKAIGVDSAAGGDNTALAASDELGLIELKSLKTPDTADITDQVITFGMRHGVAPEDWLFDAGGGGKQHADRLARMGYSGCRVIAFGSAPSIPPHTGMTLLGEKVDILKKRYTYKNRRAEMYGELSNAVDPTSEFGGWAIPSELEGPQYAELRRQMAPLPVLRDGEGRLWMYPKNRRGKNDHSITLTDLLGCSPDELDAVMLSYFGVLNRSREVEAGIV